MPGPRVITETHQWVIAAFVDVDDKQAAWAVRRGNVDIDACKVEALEVICAMCRRAWEDAVDQPCASGVDNSHLRGGHPDGRRRPRSGPGATAANE